MKKATLVIMTCLLVFGLLGCETSEGIEQDLENAGQQVEDAVN